MRKGKPEQIKKTANNNTLSICIIMIAYMLLFETSNAQNTVFRRPVTVKEPQVTLKALSVKFVDATSYLPKNYNKNGKIDYTMFIQRAIDDNYNIIMPNFPILVTGLKLKSNSNIYFNKKSKLILQPTSSTHYMVLALLGIENVNIYNPTIEGDYDRHLGDKGEWGYGIDIRGSRNINIIGANISNCWGDGICISSNANQFTEQTKLFNSENILISNSLIDFSRRNGITIASGVKDVVIDNVTITNTFGTLPKAAIDIEPDHNRGKLENIIIKNSNFFNNAAGINIHLNAYLDPVKANKVSVTVENVIFRDQASAFYFGGFASKPNKASLKGLINIENVDINNVSVPISRRNNSFGAYPEIRFRNIKIGGKFANRSIILKGVKDLHKFELF